MNTSTATQHQLPYPRICIPITAPTLDQAQEQIRTAAKHTDLIELRADFIPGLTIQHLTQLHQATQHLQTILTIRAPQEGGHFNQDEPTRIALIVHALTLGFAYIDIELSSLLRHPELVYPVATSNGVSGSYTPKLITSYHNFKSTPESSRLNNTLTQMKPFSPHIYKLACTANSPQDAQRLLKLILDHPDQHIISIGMGPHGKMTRILGPLLGGYLTFASFDQQASAPGQIDIQQLKTIYNILNTNL